MKLLLLGAGESGKSTFLKQMKIIHKIAFNADQIQEYRQIIYQNIIKGIRVLVDASNKLGIPLEKEENNFYGQQMLLFDNLTGVHQNNFGWENKVEMGFPHWKSTKNVYAIWNRKQEKYNFW